MSVRPFGSRIGNAIGPNRVDPAIGSTAVEDATTASIPAAELEQAIDQTCDWLRSQQAPEGYWVGELEGDTILESEYILLLAWLGRSQSPEALRCARYILQQQQPGGGWGQFPGAPIEISAAVKSYLALKITGQDPESEPMQRARDAIRAAGGAERVNSFTRYYLALLGIISYHQCPAVPPEVVLLPGWFPLNISEMSAWSRTIVVPLSLLWAYQPVTTLPAEQRIDELFLASPEELPVSMPPCELLDDLTESSWINWGAFFRGLDRVWKGLEWSRIKPLRSLAIRRASKWMIDRFEDSDGLGAIFPPIVWSIIGLRCLGYAEDHPLVVKQLQELEALTISEEGVDRLQPCKSPVWDTAIALLALRDADVPPTDPAIRRSADWLLSKECRRAGDWSDRKPHVEPGGWYFEFNNDFYPDVDDTGMVAMALGESLGGVAATRYTATLLDAVSGRNSPQSKRLSAVVSGRPATSHDEPDSDAGAALQDLTQLQPTLDAIRRGANWLLAMQSRNGGWGAFDADNTRELLTRVPFADHNAMIDPPTADISARTLEMFGRLGMKSHPAIDRALAFIWQDQQPDGSWYGRWGVNYLYGTWQCIVGLTAIGIAPHDRRLQRAADWIETVQQSDGGWGESALSYDNPSLRGQGPTTASQTAWALMGLMAAGRTNSDAVRRGVAYLLNTQRPDGTWEELEFTGTGFPKVFYLKYHLYCISFPLMALGRYRRISRSR
ncbi:MAG: prenyltransferase/squalene oxidase repeat-containing protein [Planctomycetaceae bacterium]